MLAHLRGDAYELYRSRTYPPEGTREPTLSYEENVRLIEAAKHELPRRALHATRQTT
jgi:hypothetical protein